MHARRPARYLLCLVFLFFLTPGCQMFQADPSLAVLVRDAETKKPLPTAEVYLCQRLKQDTVAPCHSSGLTQEDGVAQVRAEAGGEFGIQLQAIARGYLPETLNVTAESLKKIAPAPNPRTSEPRPPDFVVEVYAEPGFTVELVLPPGYRGLIKADIQLQENLATPPGQRCFRFAVSPEGMVRINGPALLRRVAAPDYRARYANGPLLGKAMDAETVGFRWLKGSGGEHFFVAGTQMDYETHHRRLSPEETSGSVEDNVKESHQGKYRYSHITSK
jgi:hypothetical protein